LTHPGSRNAYSLLETLLAVGLLALVVVAVLTLMSGGLRLLSQSESVEEANSLAREQVEAIKARIYSPVVGTFDGRIPTAKSNNFPPSPYPYPVGTRSRPYAIQVTVYDLDERLLSVQVDVFSRKARLSGLSTLIKK
jgi:type II secretory pathway pseudopilin PulG